MNEQPSVRPHAASAQPPVERSTRGAPDPAAPEISEIAALPLPDLLQRLHSSDTGLSASEAEGVLAVVGPNRVETASHKRLLFAIAERFSNPLVLILLFAAGVSAFTGDVPSF